MPVFTVPIHESNTCHSPAGSPAGGQFCSDSGDSGEPVGAQFGTVDPRVTNPRVGPSWQTKWYSFPRNGAYEATHLGSFPAKEIQVSWEQTGTVEHSQHLQAVTKAHGFVAPAGTELVYRLGSATSTTLAGRNGANADGLVNFIERTDENNILTGDTVHVHAVKFLKPFGKYQHLRRQGRLSESNDCHTTAGSPTGGQFCEGPGSVLAALHDYRSRLVYSNDGGRTWDHHVDSVVKAKRNPDILGRTWLPQPTDITIGVVRNADIVEGPEGWGVAPDVIPAKGPMFHFDPTKGRDVSIAALQAITGQPLPASLQQTLWSWSTSTEEAGSEGRVFTLYFAHGPDVQGRVELVISPSGHARYAGIEKQDVTPKGKGYGQQQLLAARDFARYIGLKGIASYPDTRTASATRAWDALKRKGAKTRLQTVKSRLASYGAGPVEFFESNDCHTPAGSPEGGRFCSGHGPLHIYPYEKGSAKIPDYLKPYVAEARQAGIAVFHHQQPEPVETLAGEIVDPLAMSHAASGEHTWYDDQRGSMRAPMGRVFISTRGGEWVPTEQVYKGDFRLETRTKKLTPDSPSLKATVEDVVSTFQHEVGHLMDRAHVGGKIGTELAREIRAWQFAVESLPDHRVSEPMLRRGLMSHAYSVFRGNKLATNYKGWSYDKQELVNRALREEVKRGELDPVSQQEARTFTLRVMKSLRNYGDVLRRKGIQRRVPQARPPWFPERTILPGPGGRGQL